MPDVPIHVQRSHRSDGALPPLSELTSSSCTVESSLPILQDLITSGKPILYEGKSFKDDGVVSAFVKDHKILSTVMLGTLLLMYTDPCLCCIPAHGRRDIAEKIPTVELAVDYLLQARDQEKTIDVAFVRPDHFASLGDELKKHSLETHLIVACDNRCSVSAGNLRMQGIPAVDDQDYFRCAPLNAVVALSVFGKLMSC